MGDLSFGAIGGAIIAAFVSFLSLVISKDHKISEFRQAWIDQLRQEITDYLTNFNSLIDKMSVHYPDQATKVAALQANYASLNKATFSITLRLNSRERLSRDLIGHFGEIQNLASDESNMKPENMRPIEAKILNTSQQLLKNEWSKVKHGEITFRVTKMVLLIISISCVAYAAFVIISGQTAPKRLSVVRTAAAAQTGTPQGGARTTVRIKSQPSLNPAISQPSPMPPINH